MFYVRILSILFFVNFSIYLSLCTLMLLLIVIFIGITLGKIQAHIIIIAKSFFIFNLPFLVTFLFQITLFIANAKFFNYLTLMPLLINYAEV